ncbi:MAG TPA: DNA repair protein RecN [Fimbriimonadales bacterium]|jgi:DNA repair protein RecN (Recombination protein N)|nr:DNA repair protein RecN [Fimbriimonadales bacterium]
MLVELVAENVAIMDKARLNFGPGFTAITGETGAGKTLLIGSISLCLGERVGADTVRAGAAQAVIQAVFDPPAATKQLLEELGYASEDALYLQREISAEGRNQCRINGRLAPLSALKRIGDSLADLHGQHEHQRLLDSSAHLMMLDEWIGKEAFRLRERVAKSCSRVRDTERRIAELQTNDREREQMLDLLRFQISEIEEAGIRPDERDQIDREIARLKGAEDLAAHLNHAAESAFTGEVSAKDLLSEALRSVRAATAIDPRLEKIGDDFHAALMSLEESAIALKEAQENIEFNPERLEEIAGRLDQLSKLRRKYGDTEEAVLEFLGESKKKLRLLEGSDADREDLQTQLDTEKMRLAEDCAILTKLRTNSAKSFSGLVEAELADLAMPKATFLADLGPKEPSTDGADACEFIFSANAGEPPRSLSKIASGGEISRVMLAIKTIMAGKGDVPTLIFDEIDAGLGGQTAAIVAKKLEQLAKNYQVIVITHVPQIASRAAVQVSIEKKEVDSRSVTRVRRLQDSERIDEIARMLAGEKVSAAAVENAKHLLKG